MAVYQLRSSHDPREALVNRLLRQGTPPVRVLFETAAFHGQLDPRTPLRRGWIAAGGHVCTSPEQVEPLLILLLQRLDAMWHQCAAPEDDLLVAAFALWCLLRIHPFPNGNGRSAIDFARVQLSHRWGLPQTPSVPAHAHKEFTTIVSRYVTSCDGSDPHALFASETALVAELRSASLSSLKEHPGIRDTACWFGSRLTFAH